MFSNKEIASQFELLADLLDISGANSFKTKSYSIAAFRISKLPEPVMEMTDSDVKKIPNIGPAVIAKLEELKNNGKIEELEQLLSVTPPGILDILQIKGLGAKKARQLWLELEITSLGELEYACQENRLTTLKGFGAKTQDKILANIQFIKANIGKALYAEVEVKSYELLEELLNTFAAEQTTLVGDIARQNIIVECIEFLTTIEKEKVLQYLKSQNATDIIQDENSLSGKIESLPKLVFHLCDAKNFAALQFEKNSSADFLEQFPKNYQNAESEAAIFQQNKMNFISPAKRELENWNIVISPEFKEQDYIQEQDINALIHCHSTYSDGANSIKEMANACIQKGYEYMVLTDHSVSAFYANGLTAERIKEQHKEIDKLNEQLAPFRIFKGIECDIQYSGDLDYNEAVWKSFEIIIASVHSNLSMEADKANERMLKALDNPYITLLGHPTGRLLLSRDGYPIDHEKVINKCAEKNIAIEINAHPRRLDLDWHWVNYALDKGVKISINPDAHSVTGIDLVRFGVKAAQKTLLKKEDNLSSYSLEAFQKYLG